MKNKKLLSALLALSFAALTACGGPATGDGQTPEPGTASLPVSELPAAPLSSEPGADLFFSGQYGTITHNGSFYECEPYYDYDTYEFYGRVLRTDLTTATQEVIWQGEEFTYGSLFTDPAYTYIYVMFEKAIYRMGFDGSGFTQLASAPWGTFSGLPATDGTWLYLTLFEWDQATETDKVEWVRVSMADGSVEALPGGPDDVDFWPVGTSGDSFILLSSELIGDAENEWVFTKTFTTWSPTTGQTEALGSFTGGWNLQYRDGEVWDIVDDGGKLTITTQPLTGGESKQLATSVSYHEECWVSESYSGKAILNVWDEGEETMQYFLLDLSTGATEPFTLRYLSHPDITPDITTGTDSTLLVQYRFEEVTRTDIGPDGKEYEFEDLIRYRATIPTTDFFANQPNYTEVT